MPGQRVTLGIRPDHLSDPAPADAEPAAGTGLAADVDYVEVLGSERLHFFDPATGAAIAPAGTPAAPG